MTSVATQAVATTNAPITAISAGDPASAFFANADFPAFASLLQNIQDATPAANADAANMNMDAQTQMTGNNTLASLLDAARKNVSDTAGLKLMAVLKQGAAPVQILNAPTDTAATPDADASPTTADANTASDSTDNGTLASLAASLLAQVPEAMRPAVIEKLKARGIDLEALAAGKTGTGANAGTDIGARTPLPIRDGAHTLPIVQPRQGTEAQSQAQPDATDATAGANDAVKLVAAFRQAMTDVMAGKDAQHTARSADTQQTAQASAPQAQQVSALAQQAQRNAAPADMTVAQSVPARFGGTGGDTSGNSSDNARRDNRNPPDRTDPSAIPAAQRSAPQAPATQAAQASFSADTGTQAAAQASAISGQTAQATPASTISAALHVQQQAQPHQAQPDINALAVNIAAKSESGAKHFDIRLDPPELGRIDVRLSVDDSGKAQAHLTADSQSTLDLLQRDSRSLERSLKDAGLDLANNGLNFSLKGQERQSGNNDGKGAARGRQLSVSAVAAEGPAAATISQSSLAHGDVRLDIRV